MTKSRLGAMSTAFFERLINQIDRHRSPVNDNIRRVQILCGRWLALQRLRLKLTGELIAQRIGVHPEIIFFLESGLADSTLAPPEAWDRLSYALVDARHNARWIRAVTAMALGQALASHSLVLERVLADLAPTFAENEPRPSIDQFVSGTVLWRLRVVQWLGRYIRPTLNPQPTAARLTVTDPSGAMMIQLTNVDLNQVTLFWAGPSTECELEGCYTIPPQDALMLAYINSYLNNRYYHITSQYQHNKSLIRYQETMSQNFLTLDQVGQQILHDYGHALVSSLTQFPCCDDPSLRLQYNQTADGSARSFSGRSYIHLMLDEHVVMQTWECLHTSPSERYAATTFDESIRVTLDRLASVEEVVAHTSRLVLLGEPGSGKSTVLRRLALQLAQHVLDSTTSLPDGWEVVKIPLLCSLPSLATALEQTINGDIIDLLWQASVRPLAPIVAKDDLLYKYIRQTLYDGTALLLFDGFDEVPAASMSNGFSLRDRVHAALQTLAATLPLTTHIVVTCRSYPYQLPLFPEGGWDVRVIQPLSHQQVMRLATHPYEPSGNDLSADTGEEPLLTSPCMSVEWLIENHRLDNLVQSPLHLYMARVIHSRNKIVRVPDYRVQLYDAYVSTLLNRERRSSALYMESCDNVTSDGTTSPTFDRLVRITLEKFAFRLLTPGYQSVTVGLGESEFVAELQRALIAEQEPFFETQLREATHTVFSTSGLLQQRSDEVYHFTHRTVQEFLAACHLARSPNELLVAYQAWRSNDGDCWREVLVLLLPCLIQQGQSEENCLRWLDILTQRNDLDGQRKSVQQYWRDALVAADGYQECDSRILHQNSTSATMMPLERTLACALTQVFSPHSQATLNDRLRAGRHLAILGDRRPGIITLEPFWCDVSDSILMLDDNEASQIRRVHVPAFRIARYPVTNAQWKSFINSGGYTNPIWWGDWWDICMQDGWTQPRFWEDPRFNQANHPVVGISWYEAMAFCAWLTAYGRVHGWLLSDQSVRLPTETEWEQAAGWDVERRARRAYPWGDTWDSSRANTAEGCIGTTTPVGCYPDGISSIGALDMSGNVWEWCSPPWTMETRRGHPGVLQQAFVARGGSWADDATHARCVTRHQLFPSTRGNLLGMRLAMDGSTYKFICHESPGCVE